MSKLHRTLKFKSYIQMFHLEVKRNYEEQGNMPFY